MQLTALQLDPVYVVADINGGAIPSFPLVPVGAPIGPLVPLNGRGYAWTFNSIDDASFWCGVVPRAIPAMRLWMFDCPTPCKYW